MTDSSNILCKSRNYLLRLWKFLTKPPQGVDEHLNLRAWFIVFVVYMAGLAVAVLQGLSLIQMGCTGWGTVIWVIAGMMFYLSLCCTFCPLPTAWLILAVSSGQALEQLIGPVWAEALNSVLGEYWKVLIVGLLGGLATTMANLNEYHILTFLLRYRPIAKLRQTDLHDWAGRWFNKAPFTLLTVFCFIPIPVDVIRWLASSHRYPRNKFFLANMLGRGSRYSLMAVFSNALELGLWAIVLIQVGLVLLAAGRVLPRIWARRKRTANKADA